MSILVWLVNLPVPVLLCLVACIFFFLLLLLFLVAFSQPAADRIVRLIEVLRHSDSRSCRKYHSDSSHRRH
jgi:hypothetical protein